MRSAPTSLRRRLHGIMFKLPMMITCEVFESFILAYLEDELTARQTRVFEMHLSLCRECREYLDAYRQTMNLTRLALDSESEATLANIPEDLITAVIAARDT